MDVFIRTNHAGQQNAIIININHMSLQFKYEQYCSVFLLCVFIKPH